MPLFQQNLNSPLVNGPTLVSGAVDAVTLAVPSHTQPAVTAQDQGNNMTDLPCSNIWLFTYPSVPRPTRRGYQLRRENEKTNVDTIPLILVIDLKSVRV